MEPVKLDSSKALAKLQLIELDILVKISELCDAYHIEWWLDSGTCLGAVRHGGFIPWDDDIDIGMMRPDYDRFCKIALAGGLPEGYSLHTSNNTPGYAAMFAKVYKDGTTFENQESREAKSNMGIFVDVFPYDYLYEDSRMRAKQMKLALRAQRGSYLYHSSSINVPHKGLLGIVEKASCRLLHIIERVWNSDASSYQSRFDQAIPDPRKGRTSDEVISLAWPYINSVKFADVVPTTQQEFEGRLFPVPGNTEKYLTAMYGDWRKIPSPEERHTHLPLQIDFGDGEVWKA